MNEIHKIGDIVYYARIIPTLGIYDVCELKIRTVTDTYFVGTDKRDKRAYLFSYNAVGKCIFSNRKEAVDKAIMEEEKAPKLNKESYYKEEISYETDEY